MNLASLKELMLRKTENDALQTLIKMVSEEVLADHVIESLKKMAIRRGVGSHANIAIRDFGVEMDPELEPAMMREALGHHASRYKASLAAGDQNMANKHASKFFKMLDLIHHAQPHSHGKLQAEVVDIKPWERTHSSRSDTFADRIARDPEYAKDNPVSRGKKKPHQFVNDTVGFSFQPKGNDWSFLQNDPHEAYQDETSKHGHVGSYPMEHTKINGKYIPIEDVKDIYDGRSSHPFDNHPILSHYGESVKTRNPERDAQYKNEHEAYMSSPHIEGHLNHQQALIDSGKHSSRGLEPGEQVHPTSRRVEVGKLQQKTPQQQAPQQQTPPKQGQQKVVVRKAPTGDKENIKSQLPPHLRDLLKD